jgi:hypothetical protein
MTLNWETVVLHGKMPIGRWGAVAASLGSEIVYLGGMNLSSYLSMT